MVILVGLRLVIEGTKAFNFFIIAAIVLSEMTIVMNIKAMISNDKHSDDDDDDDDDDEMYDIIADKSEEKCHCELLRTQ